MNGAFFVLLHDIAGIITEMVEGAVTESDEVMLSK